MSLVSLILLLVLVGIVVRLTVRRNASLPGSSPGASADELEAVRRQLDDMSTRLARLEEERDFYQELLDAPDRQQLLDDAGERDDDSGRA